VAALALLLALFQAETVLMAAVAGMVLLADFQAAALVPNRVRALVAL
jgi:hypothetical protein